MRNSFRTTRRDDLTLTPLVGTQPPPAATTTRRSVLIRIGTSALIVAVVASFLAGVATNHIPTFGSPRTPVAPKRGGSIVDDVGFDPDTLLPQRPGQHSGGSVEQAIWAPLWYGDPQGAFHAGLAKEVPSATNGDISPDLRTWRIRLRPGLKWSDGTALTAADCAFSFTLYADPAFGANGFVTTDPADPIGFQSATVADTDTVVLKLKHPYVAMNALLADGVATCLPQELFAGMTAVEIARSPQTLWPTVVSGPFKVKERVGNDHVTVVRNPYYYQGPDKPYLDRITFQDGNGEGPLTPLLTRNVDTEGGLIDYASLADYQAIPGYTTYLGNPAGYETLAFNLNDALMSDHAIRQAITMGFDTHAVLALLNGTAQLTCDDSAGTFAHEPKLVPCYTYDPTKAGQILDADGWVMGADGVRYKTIDGKDTPLELAFATTSRPFRHNTAILIRRELASIGMKINVTEYAPADLFCGGSECVLAGGHFQIGEFASGDGYDPDDAWFLASDRTPEQGGFNDMRYSNPEVDAQESIQQSRADITARTKAFHIIHEEVLKDLPVMYLYSQQGISCARSDLHNYNPSAEGAGETWNVWDWWLG